MVKQAIFFMIAMLTGTLLSFEGALFGKLGENVGELEANWYNFTMGAIIALVLLIFFRRGNLTEALHLPRWNFLGGVLGVIYMLAIVIGVPLIGVGLSMIIVIIGQITTSILIDHYGWLHNKKKPIQVRRIASMLFMLCALILTLI
ncbi:DMT family transporter [Paenibacillus sp. WLX2291]|uniref:DMT family transporter n=1 Tax=Paenibacillus sp. WLX2291 TaxID=3296934 RepID=UPI0039844AF0